MSCSSMNCAFDGHQRCAGHDHSRCSYSDGVFSLPAHDCDWPGHGDALAEHGWCPVCQH